MRAERDCGWYMDDYYVCRSGESKETFVTLSFFKAENLMVGVTAVASWF